jgi:hydrogenase-4 component B
LPLEPFRQLAGNLTRAAALILAVFVVILGLRSWFYRGKLNARSGTWGCGFTQPTARMQYTGTSYAASILEFFRPAAPLQEDHPPIQGRFPAATHYHSHIDDIAERSLAPLIVRPLVWLFDKLRWLQHGDIHLYIGYILLAIVLLLFYV